MAFVDERIIRANAGRGGDGVVRWRHEKYNEFAGPSGGNGGRGGDVYVIGVRDILCLSKYQENQLFKAESGESGRSSSQEGKQGKDLYIRVPIGSLIRNLETNNIVEILTEDSTVCLAKGGQGGYGNEHFKGPTNQAPQEATEGQLGEVGTFQIELQLIADIGLVGLPNAGKTSLLNSLTNALGKVGNYQFTTLEPNLGVMDGLVLADIPGLIEGAADGKGLGVKFLKHIKRTKHIFHCISFKRDLLRYEYETIVNELSAFSEELIDRKHTILLTKIDNAESEQDLAGVVSELEDIRRFGEDIVTVSIIDDGSLVKLREYILKTIV